MPLTIAEYGKKIAELITPGFASKTRNGGRQRNNFECRIVCHNELSISRCAELVWQETDVALQSNYVCGLTSFFFDFR